MAPPLNPKVSDLVEDLSQELNIPQSEVHSALSRVAARRGWYLFADEPEVGPPARTREQDPPHINELRARSSRAS